MACIEDDDVIDEPVLDASNYTILTDEELEVCYKLKYPDFYSITPCTMLKLLDDEVLLSQLQNSVKTFVHHAREMHKMEKQNLVAPSISAEAGRIGSAKDENTMGKETDTFDMSVSSTDLSLYDSVHSINIPHCSYENVIVKTPKPTYFRRKKPNTSEAVNVKPKGGRQMIGMVYQRVEESVHFPHKYKSNQVSCQTYHGKKGGKQGNHVS